MKGSAGDRMRRGSRILRISLVGRLTGGSRLYVLPEGLKLDVSATNRWDTLLGWGEESAARQDVGSETDVERIVHQLRSERW